MAFPILGVALPVGGVALALTALRLRALSKNAIKLTPAQEAANAQGNRDFQVQLAAQKAAGTVLTGVNGVDFAAKSPDPAGTPMPRDVAEQLEPGLNLTVDVQVAKISIPGQNIVGNILCRSTSRADFNTGTIKATSVDPRIADTTTVFNVPLTAITGISG